MKFCNTCKWWDLLHAGGLDKFGACTHDSVPDMLRITDNEDLDEPTLFTASTFGCIYHEAEGKNLAITAIHIKKKQ